jgi:hypothetical protein
LGVCVPCGCHDEGCGDDDVFYFHVFYGFWFDVFVYGCKGR